jgi:NhaA family Na+:H+ antiporter
MATDIAFALGVLSLLGDRSRPGSRVFLAAVAIVDDIGAVLVIAIWYSGAISLTCLTVGARSFRWHARPHRSVRAIQPSMPCSAWPCGWRFCPPASTPPWPGSWRPWPYRPARASRRGLSRPGPGVPWSVSRRPRPDIRVSRGKRAALDELDRARLLATTPLQRIEHTLHPYVAFGIMPLFSLANAGVTLTGSAGLSLTEPVSLGIVVGLVVGKQVGVFLPCWAMFRLGLAQKADGLGAVQYYGAACLAGIGFTMSIFISGLAFAGHGDLEARAKVAVLTASTLAGVVGYLVLRLSGRQVGVQV